MVEFQICQFSGPLACPKDLLRSGQAAQKEAPGLGNRGQESRVEKAQVKEPQRARLTPGEKRLTHILIGFAPVLKVQAFVAARDPVQEEEDFGGGLRARAATVPIVLL